MTASSPGPQIEKTSEEFKRGFNAAMLCMKRMIAEASDISELMHFVNGYFITQQFIDDKEVT